MSTTEMTTTTFADYAAQQEARENIANAVLGHTLALCEALRHNYERQYGGNQNYEFYPETGRKYHKIIMDANGSRSVHAFVDKKTGSVLKSASWKAPAKGERYNLLIIKDREWLLENADWSGNYLYLR